MQSCHDWQREADTHRLSLAIFKPIRDDPKSQNFGLGDCLCSRRAIRENTGKLWHLSNPASINFLLALQSKIHGLSTSTTTLATTQARGVPPAKNPVSIPGIRLTPSGCPPEVLPRQTNAAPEWQAGSIWRLGIELMAACPLEGLVRLSQWFTSFMIPINKFQTTRESTN
jgi:hypothetical protein